MTIVQTIVGKALADFPKSPSLTLAKMIYKANNSVFATVETARQAIRYARGASGKQDRKNATHLQVMPSNPFPNLPEGKTHFDKWEPIIIEGPLRVLVIGDLHIPYHSKSAIIAAIDAGINRYAADTVLLNGDTADFFSVSFWEKDPRKRRFAEELKAVAEFIEELRNRFPKARIIFKEGNHEERWERYMFVKAPELLGVPEFSLKLMLKLDKFGVELVGDKLPIRLGDLNVIHGHEYKFAISNPVNPARGLFLRAKEYAMCNHFHQSSSHSERTIAQKNRGTWSLGCLCDLHPDYAPMNNWNHGFGFVEVFNNGKFNVENKFISESGKVY